MKTDFFSSLSKNTTVLTANRRLAADLQRQYDQYQRSQNQTAWPTANILPLNRWITQQWSQSEHDLMLLSPLQESSLWKKISQKNTATIPVIQQAWRQLHAWKIPLETLACSHHHAVQSFYQWATTLMTHCQKNHWITAAEVTLALSLDTIILPEKIVLAGFDDQAPVTQDLLNRLSNRCCITTLNAPSVTATVKRYALDHTESEIQHMATWAHQLHQINADLKIACVIPNLTAIRHDVVRHFSDTFNDAMAYNIAAGQSLSAFPIIQVALHIINDQWDRLLQSPYAASHDEDIDFGALVDKIRRAKQIKHLNLSALLPILSQQQPHFPASSLLKRCNQLRQHQKKRPTQQTLTDWLADFTQTLSIMQWPGHRTLNSVELQIMNRWQHALEELTACQQIVGNLTYQQAYDLLNNHIEQIVFQEKTQHKPIQILGILETAGLSFDHLWLMGLDNENWPAASSPNPFLPYALQRDEKMPHACAERELHFTEKTQKRLLTSAPSICLSSPNQAGDKQLKPSRLITHFSASEPDPIRQEKKQMSKTNNPIEYLEDHQAPHITEAEIIQGGTYILKLQSICPFKAFATLRLNADHLEQPKTGLCARQRGQLLHTVLEKLWKQLQSQMQLINTDETELNQMIEQAITQTLSTANFSSHHRAFIAVERQRLSNIIQDWLAIEKDRQPFTVVANEEQHTLQIGQLSFRCRIDRIDELHNQKRLVIDYKSGYTRIEDWYGERPADPQLPIYCVFAHNTEAYSGVAYAQVRAGKMQFKAVTSEDSEFFPDNISHWSELTSHWKTTLTQLSNDFFAGHAQVNPLIPACEYCELKPLCRVNNV